MKEKKKYKKLDEKEFEKLKRLLEYFSVGETAKFTKFSYATVFNVNKMPTLEALKKYYKEYDLQRAKKNELTKEKPEQQPKIENPTNEEKVNGIPSQLPEPVTETGFLQSFLLELRRIADALESLVEAWDRVPPKESGIPGALKRIFPAKD